VAKGRAEDNEETMLRHRVYKAIKTKVPAELSAQLDNGDVKSLYINIISMGQQDAAEQTLYLEAKLERHGKKKKVEGTPLASWLDELYRILKDLSLLAAPKINTQLRLFIMKSLIHADGYKDVLRDIKRKDKWGMIKIR
jgi:hypothetical protein